MGGAKDMEKLLIKYDCCQCGQLSYRPDCRTHLLPNYGDNLLYLANVPHS
jgi:hypothetical protein